MIEANPTIKVQEILDAVNTKTTTAAVSTKISKLKSAVTLEIDTKTSTIKEDIGIKLNEGKITTVSGAVLVHDTKVITIKGAKINGATKILDLSKLGYKGNPTLAIEVSWGVGKDSNGNHKYWTGGMSGMFYFLTDNVAYNATAALAIDMRGSVHHNTTSMPEFTIDSDNSKDISYGQFSIFMKCPVNITFDKLVIKIKQIF